MRISAIGLLILLMVIPFTPTISAQSHCEPYAPTHVGEFTFQNRLIDNVFLYQGECNKWVFSGNAHIRPNQSCSYGNNEVQFQGVYSSRVSQVSMYQDITVPYEGPNHEQWNSFQELGFSVAIDAVVPTPLDKLKISILDPVTGATLEQVASIASNASPYCQDLGGRLLNDYRGRTIRIYFRATISDPDTIFHINRPAFWVHAP